MERINEITRSIKKEIDFLHFEKVFVKYECKEADKDFCDIYNFLKTLQHTSEGIIKSFDASQHNIVEVEYCKVP